MDSIDLDSLPKAMQVMLNQLADFVEKGLNDAQAPKEVSNAY